MEIKTFKGYKVPIGLTLQALKRCNLDNYTNDLKLIGKGTHFAFCAKENLRYVNCNYIVCDDCILSNKSILEEYIKAKSRKPINE